MKKYNIMVNLSNKTDEELLGIENNSIVEIVEEDFIEVVLENLDDPIFKISSLGLDSEIFIILDDEDNVIFKNEELINKDDKNDDEDDNADEYDSIYWG